MGFLGSWLGKSEKPLQATMDTPAAGTTAEERAFWERNGFLILRGALSDGEVEDMMQIVDRQWRTRENNDHLVDVISGGQSGQSFRMSEIDPARRSDVYKLNNLFARNADVRAIGYNARVKAVVADLLGGEPLICNSLNFERGSQQSYHFDTWYMPPPVADMMIAANFALENVDEENGPFTFYPGSHRIPAYRFSTGQLNMVEEEAPLALEHIQRGLDALQLTPDVFIGRKGDVLLWHAQLFHGGRPIVDLNRTRNSFVVHYWRAQDLHPTFVARDESGAYLNQTLRGEFVY